MLMLTDFTYQISKFARRLIVAKAQKPGFRPWTWDACRNRLQKLKEGGNRQDAIDFWLRLDNSMRAEIEMTREQRAMLEESRARMEDLWGQMDMQVWFNGLAKGAFEDDDKEEEAAQDQAETGGSTPAF